MRTAVESEASPLAQKELSQERQESAKRLREAKEEKERLARERVGRLASPKLTAVRQDLTSKLVAAKEAERNRPDLKDRFLAAVEKKRDELTASPEFATGRTRVAAITTRVVPKTSQAPRGSARRSLFFLGVQCREKQSHKPQKSGKVTRRAR